MLYTPNLPKAASEHNSKTQIAVGASRSRGAGMRPRRRRRVGRGRSPSREAAARARARARTLGVNMLSENAFQEMPTLANRWSNFRFSSGIQVYFWTQRVYGDVVYSGRQASHMPRNLSSTTYPLSVFSTNPESMSFFSDTLTLSTPRQLRSVNYAIHRKLCEPRSPGPSDEAARNTETVETRRGSSLLLAAIFIVLTSRRITWRRR